MGLDMYLEKMPRYKATTVKEVLTIQSYFKWKGNGEPKGYAFEEWTGRSLEDLPPKETMDYYKQFCTTKYYTWDKEHEHPLNNTIVEEVAYWRKANAIHKWFVDNVQSGKDDCDSYEVSREQLVKLLGDCEQVKAHNELAEELLPTQSGFFFGSIEYDKWYFS